MTLAKMTVSTLVVTFLLMCVMGTAVKASTAETDEFEEAKQLITQQISCQQLSDDQLEKIGDYVMEQMAPGAAHVQMEQMIGGEGSASLRQAHIFMARRWYCGDAAGFGMMGMMMGGFGPGMMGSGALVGNPAYSRGFTGMMGSANKYGYGYGAGVWMFLFPLFGLAFLATGIAAFVKYLSHKK